MLQVTLGTRAFAVVKGNPAQLPCVTMLTSEPEKTTASAGQRGTQERAAVPHWATERRLLWAPKALGSSGICGCTWCATGMNGSGKAVTQHCQPLAPEAAVKGSLEMSKHQNQEVLQTQGWALPRHRTIPLHQSQSCQPSTGSAPAQLPRSPWQPRWR